MRSLSLHHICRVTSSETASAVEYRVELTSPREPGTPGTASVRGVWTALDSFAIRPCHVCGFSFLLDYHNVELYGFAFPHAPHNLLRVIPSDCCLDRMYKDVPRVSLGLMKPYRLWTLAHLTVTSTRQLVSLLRSPKPSRISWSCLLAFLLQARVPRSVSFSLPRRYLRVST